MQQNQPSGNTKPPSPGTTQHHMTIFIAVLAIIFIIIAKRKGPEGLDNPLIDLIIVTFGVFALSKIFYNVAGRLGSPGAQAFFSTNQTSTVA